MDVMREIAVALVLFGVIGAASMTIFQVALKSANAGMLPTSAASRVRWWQTHLMAALAVSACLLLVGFLGLILL